MGSAASRRSPSRKTADEALREAQNDVDVQQEAADLAALRLTGCEGPCPATCEPANCSDPVVRKGAAYPHVPLSWRPGQGGHKANQHTLQLFREAGKENVLKMTKIFYDLCFADPHIDKFIRDHNDPHGERFANFIAEKFGDGQPWTKERSGRKVESFESHGYRLDSPHDRSSAHFAAWHSPKREDEKFGDHFNLEDSRVWMRLHCWGMREAGIYERSPSFADYYIRFIGHFVSVYESRAPPFARESARWSGDAANIEAYRKAGNRMVDVIGVADQDALRRLPEREQPGHADWPNWPYEY